MLSRVLLIAEPNALTIDLIDSLRREGLDVDLCGSSARATRRLRQDRWPLVVLQESLPGIDGVAGCLQLREGGHAGTILALAPRDQGSGRLRRLLAGADDCLSGGFTMAEFTTRVHALLRRARPARGAPPSWSFTLRSGDIEIDRVRRGARVNGRTVTLTPRQHRLLLHFVEHPNQVFSRSELLSSVWGCTYQGYEHTVSSQINRLRRRIEPLPTRPRYIQTVWGVGYRLIDEATAVYDRLSLDGDSPPAGGPPERVPSPGRRYALDFVGPEA